MTAPGEVEEVVTTASGRAGRRHGIGLCLSGGGFRAALFHLGALRRLHETGILARVETVSSVSGGSILAAFLATRLVRLGLPNGLCFSDWGAEVARPFRAFAARDLRTFPVLAHVLWNWLLPEFRVRHLERRCHARLTDLTLGELPARPNFILCAADLTFGVNFEFSRERAGDWQAGYAAEPGRWSLASAVAASACFPPLFGPMRVQAAAADFQRGKYRKNDREVLLKRLRLTDGGVYDNMALEPVWKSHQWVLVSDCGAPFEFHVGLTPLRRLLRYTSVISNQTRALRKRALFADFGQRRMEGAYWSISSATTSGPAAGMLGYPKPLVDVITRIRTDLDAFSAAEMDILENHGYFAAERSIRRRLSHLVRLGAPGSVAPYPAMLDESLVRAALKNSHKSVSLRRFRLTQC